MYWVLACYGVPFQRLQEERHPTKHWRYKSQLSYGYPGRLLNHSCTHQFLDAQADLLVLPFDRNPLTGSYDRCLTDGRASDWYGYECGL